MPWQWPWTRHDRDLFQVGSIPVSSTYAAVAVNPTTAMQHSAVWACVNLIAGSISTLPLAAYRRGDRDPLPDLPPILRQPCCAMPASFRPCHRNRRALPSRSWSS